MLVTQVGFWIAACSQSNLGEREKQITMKNKPPPIEYHLINEEPEIMTVTNSLLCFVIINTGCLDGRVSCYLFCVSN